MLYAINKNGEKVKAFKTGERAKCPFTGAEVMSKCGAIKTNHWAYVNAAEGIDYKGETEWYLEWKSLFPAENCEVLHTDKFGNHHIADVDLGDLVIEFQHSPISSLELIQRELFYTSIGKQFVWVLDGKTYLKDAKIYTIKKFVYHIEYLSRIQRQQLFNSRHIDNLKWTFKDKVTTITFDTKNSDALEKELNVILKDYQLQSLKREFTDVPESMLISSNKKIYQISRSPIFIDLSAYYENSLYSCLEQRIVSKHQLIERKCLTNEPYENLYEEVKFK